jgi:hypothetical protein
METIAVHCRHCAAPIPPRRTAPQCRRDAPPGRLSHAHSMETIAMHCRHRRADPIAPHRAAMP